MNNETFAAGLYDGKCLLAASARGWPGNPCTKVVSPHGMSMRWLRSK